MQENLHIHNNIEYMKKAGFQPCVGKGCENRGTNRLIIVYINKMGWFCDNCKEDLLKLKLVYSEAEQQL